jgi:hypothetical protein
MKQCMGLNYERFTDQWKEIKYEVQDFVIGAIISVCL